MLRDPPGGQKTCDPSFRVKNICKTRKISGTTWPISHCWPVMCVSVCVCVIVKVNVLKNDVVVLWRWSLWKKTTYLSVPLSIANIFTHTLLLSLGFSYSPKYRYAICWPRKYSFLVFCLLSCVSISSHFWCQLLRGITILPLLLRKNLATSL